MTEPMFNTNYVAQDESSQKQPVPAGQEAETSGRKDVEGDETSLSESSSPSIHHHQSISQQQQQQQQQLPTTKQQQQSQSIPSVEEHASALINYRVLVSAKEAGALIGQNGQVINSIREHTNTKAGISKLVAGSHERILTVSGTLDNAAKALSLFAQALCNTETDTSYVYFPLKQLSSIPNVPGKITSLRLLISNNQMGTLIGFKGARIQQIQAQFHVSMIASKSFLPQSTERLVELQGSVDDLYESLRVISRCLNEDFSSIVGTTYYTPRSRRTLPMSNNSAVQSLNSTSSSFNSSSSISAISSKILTEKVAFQNNMVGALIGKNGSRIQGVRKISGATIGISDEVEGATERIFTIQGTQQAIDKAKELLYHNLEKGDVKRHQNE